MTWLPIRRAQFDTENFVAWLAKNGAEIGKPTNPYEVVRYRAYSPDSKRPMTHIVYAKENGLLNFQGRTKAHYQAFLAGESIAQMFVSKFDVPQPVPNPERQSIEPSVTAKQRAKIRARDGEGCWFCGEALGHDATIEHLIPKSKGGGNSLANYVLAHSRCNSLAADKPLVEKIAMRARMRGDVIDVRVLA